MQTWLWRLVGVPANSSASRKKLGVIALLYFIQGAPAAILWEVLPVYFRINGVSLRAIGGLRLLELPYSLKVFWSPLVHRSTAPKRKTAAPRSMAPRSGVSLTS